MTETRQIRLMIVDDHRVVRSGLSAFLLAYDDLELVAEASGGEEAVRLCAEVKPDVVLMDLVMPGMDGIAATKSIRERCPKTQVIALTSFGDQERVQAALRAGAIGYLLKDVSDLELVAAVRNAAAGQPTLAADAQRALIQAATSPKPLGSDLTEREREVLALMVKGMSNDQIADHLVIRPSTAKFHVSNVLSKLGVTTRTEAVAVALQHRLVKSDQ
jgi:NarL family two-component system response regulator LiaR